MCIFDSSPAQQWSFGIDRGFEGVKMLTTSLLSLYEFIATSGIDYDAKRTCNKKINSLFVHSSVYYFLVYIYIIKH